MAFNLEKNYDYALFAEQKRQLKPDFGLWGGDDTKFAVFMITSDRINILNKT